MNLPEVSPTPAFAEFLEHARASDDAFVFVQVRLQFTGEAAELRHADDAQIPSASLKIGRAHV